MTESLVRPFAGLRPAPGRASEVAAPPYDVLSSDEARERASGNANSFLHISKPEIDLAPGTDSHAPEVYARGAENLRRMIDGGVLLRDPSPCYYIYRMRTEQHVQTGLVVGASVKAYETGRIRRHELTRPDKEDDRVRQIEAVGAQTGPVMLVHHRDARLDAVIVKATESPPPASAVVDGASHEVWPISDPDSLRVVTASFESMDMLYIADGHHRSAAAARVAAARRAAGADAPDAAHEMFLAVTFPAEEMRILDYNRVVRDLAGLSPEAFLAKLEGDFTITLADGPARPEQLHHFGMYLAGRWYRLALNEMPASDNPPTARLDVSLLYETVLGPVLGIGDPRTDPRIDFIGGARGMDGLAARVDSGEMAVAFALYPTAIGDLLAVAEAGEIMPPKSTWFEPKLADGLVSLMLD